MRLSRLKSASRFGLRILANGMPMLLGDTKPSVELDQGLMLARVRDGAIQMSHGAVLARLKLFQKGLIEAIVI